MSLLTLVPLLLAAPAPEAKPATSAPAAEVTTEATPGPAPVAEAKPPTSVDPFRNARTVDAGAVVPRIDPAAGGDPAPTVAAPQAVAAPAPEPAPVTTAPAVEAPAPEPAAADAPLPRRHPDAAAPGLTRTVRPKVRRVPRYRLGIALAGGSTVSRDPGVAQFGDDRSLPMLNVDVSGEFALAQARAFAGIHALYRYSESDGEPLGGAATSEVQVHDVGGGVRASYVPVEGIDLWVRGDAGASLIELDWGTPVVQGLQNEVKPFIAGLAGFSLYMPRRWMPRGEAARITTGLSTGFGYTYRPRFSVRPAPELEEDDLPVDTASLGRLSLRGFTWNVGWFVRFI